jgi:HPt (histidine-containing phosphotransfer) domain-containing protein
LPTLRQRLADGNTQGVNDLLHQFKGFAPVFCVDSLVDLVVQVEAMSKQASLTALEEAMEPLLNQLTALQAEVNRQLGS